MTYIKQLFILCLSVFSVSIVHAKTDAYACRNLYFDYKIERFSSNNNATDKNLDASEQLYHSVRAGYNQGLHSSIFLRPFLKHKLGKMIDKFRNKTNNVLEENSISDNVEAQNIEVLRKFKNIRMQISETQDEVSRSSLAMLSWFKPWLSFLELPVVDQNKSINQLGDAYLGLQTLLLLNLRSKQAARTLVHLESYDAFLVRDIQVLEARQMVLRMDFIKDPSIQSIVREQAETIDRKLAKLILQIKVLRTILSVSQSVMKQELKVVSQFQFLYLSGTPISNIDPYLQAKDLFEMYLREANNLESQMAKMSDSEQKILQKIIRTLGR